MKKLLFIAATALLMASCSSDENTVTIHLPEDFTESTLVVSHVTIDNIFNATKQEDLVVVYDTLEVKNGVAKMKLDPAGAARYNIEPPVASRTEPDFYAAPGEKLVVTITAFDPLVYEVKGTPLMEDLTALAAITNPIQQEYFVLVNSDEHVSEQQAKEIMDRADAAIKQFVAEHPHSMPFPLRSLTSAAMNSRKSTTT